MLKVVRVGLSVVLKSPLVCAVRVGRPCHLETHIRNVVGNVGQISAN